MKIETTNTERGTKVQIFVNGEKVESVHIFKTGDEFYISDDIDCVEYTSEKEAIKVIVSRIDSEAAKSLEIENAVKDESPYGNLIITAYNSAHPETLQNFLQEAKKYVGKKDFSTFLTAHYIKNSSFINRMVGVENIAP